MIKVQSDSRRVQKGDTFIALIGDQYDGHDFIEEAIKNGASKVICEHGKYNVPTIIVKNTKKYLDNYLDINYSDVLKNMKFIGITGTNGKTTTAYLTYQLLSKLEYKTAYIGTIGFYMNNKFIKELDNTSPDIITLYNLILEAKENNCEYIIMEVSSHSLVQKRLSNISFDLEAFTNLTIDHLDYHKNMEEYLKAKMLILDKLKDNGKIIVNVDDTYSKHFINDNSITIGSSANDYKFNKIDIIDDSMIVNFSFQEEEYQFKISTTPYFNIYNIMTAVALVKELNIDLKNILRIVPELECPKGRSQKIKINNSLAVIDYAHTPDAVEKIITAFNDIKKAKLYTIVGCGGDRDSYKRPIMASIASNLSDYVIFTSDNPRKENPRKIIEDMISGVKKHNYEIEIDRKEAIKKGIKLLKDKDILLILGKGHENYQIIGQEKHHLDDEEEVKKYLEK